LPFIQAALIALSMLRTSSRSLSTSIMAGLLQGQ
jgi:hypothetical protein